MYRGLDVHPKPHPVTSAAVGASVQPTDQSISIGILSQTRALANELASALLDSAAAYARVRASSAGSPGYGVALVERDRLQRIVLQLEDDFSELTRAKLPTR